ncbi:MAG: hypothetical protein PHO26_10485 [Dehalococcoidia bacterium]|nr:hypothetical protein [Dehalococcoidia bacterium]
MTIEPPRHCGEPKLRAEGVAGSEAICCMILAQARRLPRRLRFPGMTIEPPRHCGEPKLRAEGVAGSEAICCTVLAQARRLPRHVVPRNDSLRRDCRVPIDRGSQ